MFKQSEEDVLTFYPCQELCRGCDCWEDILVEGSSGALKTTIKGCKFLFYGSDGKILAGGDTIVKTSSGYKCRFNRFKHAADVDSNKLKTTNE